MKIILHSWLLLLVGLHPILFASATQAVTPNSIDTILNEIESLEGENDPKCYATASRLEDFMFGTPLSPQARATKNELQQSLVSLIWRSASIEARLKGFKEVTVSSTKSAINSLFLIGQDKDAHWTLQFPDQRRIRINSTDKRQYSSIAYSLRAILAVQQSSLMDAKTMLLPLSQQSIVLIRDATDLYTLSVLKISDELARVQSRHELQATDIASVWQQLMPNSGEGNDTIVEIETTGEKPVSASAQYANLALTNAVIERKVRAYAKYNGISNQLFVRNLQVYFAKRRWPESTEEARSFRQLYTESLISMVQDIYAGAESSARVRGSAIIQEQDVSEFLTGYMPHRVNEYEDAIFFPRLPPKDQITIESYDMDAFRDSGIHWRYLQFALESDGFRPQLEPDPFALELITESIAQLGVLLLRLTGNIGRDSDRERIQTNDLSQAILQYHSQAEANRAAPTDTGATKVAGLASSGSAHPNGQNVGVAGAMFREVSGEVGINFMHRSSDWLSRLLRSYLQKGKTTGIISIPPAFGGSGVAVGDINNDNRVDILLLGGLGNRLYANRGGGRFEDITVAAGLDWFRPSDRRPGEARQPLIADLDNDGYQDIVITYVDDEHRVYRNNGDETFNDVTNTAGLGGTGLVGGPATVFDFDNDGLLDIYVTYFGNYINGILPTLQRRNFNGLPNKLFRNKGGFEFEDVTSKSGLDNTGWGQAVTHTDINRDHYQDVIVGNDFGTNAYYLNNGDGTFKDISRMLGTDKPSYTMGIGVADLNADQAPDFYISNIVTMNKDQKYVLPSAKTTMAFDPETLSNMRVVEANDLFLSQVTAGDLQYVPSKAVDRGYSSTGWSWGAEFFDSDNDGDDDLYVLNGMNEFNVYSNQNPYYRDPLENKRLDIIIPVDTQEANVFFLNEGGKLNNLSKESGLDLRGNSRSAAYLDYDGDGDLDIVMNNYHETASFYRNESAASNNGWLKVTLVGDAKRGVNRDAIGARLTLHTEDGGSVWREIHGSSGYMTVQTRQQHFGLAGHASADLEIIWPNGERQVFAGITSRQSLTIKYGSQKPIVMAIN
jgi:hypothetical protein